MEENGYQKQEDFTSRRAAPLCERAVLKMHSPFLARPFALLDVVPRPVVTTDLPRRIAESCFGDGELVFDVTRRLIEPGIFHVGDALGGAAPGFVPVPGESLSHFIATRKKGLILFDDLQAFPALAIETLARIADEGRACPEGSASPSLSAKQFVILAFARMQLPSPRALAQREGREPWIPGDLVPSSFQEAVQSVSRERYPEHLGSWVMSRLGGLAGCFAWDRYCDLVSRRELDTPILDDPDLAPTMRTPPSPIARDYLTDAAPLPPVAGDEAPFDVFISYSWTRTADDASWLRDYLKARGVRVFFDKDALDVNGVAEQAVKRVLVHRLSRAVQTSKAWVVFAAALKPLFLAADVSREDAIRQGVAMEVAGTAVEWSWQAMELNEMGRHLVIDAESVYAVNANGSLDASFGRHPIKARGDMIPHVQAYLAGQGVALTPRETAER
jgi:hypothetical protein